MSLLKPIQFIGTQRSGSNLLRVMINQISSIMAPHPPHILTSFDPILSAYGDISIKANYKKLVDDVCLWVENNPVPWEGVTLNRDEILEASQPRTLANLFRVIYEVGAKAHGAEYWCCKSMAAMKFYKDFETFPVKPYYLYLFRDGRDVALSFKKAYVGEKHIYSIAKKWKQDQQMALEICANVPKERCIKIRYEDLIADEESSLRNLTNFLGIHEKANFSDFHNSNEAKNASSAGEMWENLTKPVLKNNFNKYKTQMSEEDLLIFESVAGEELKALGYKLENSDEKIQKEYTEGQIRSFQEENEKLKKHVIMNTSDHEKEKKEWHESFMKEMKAKAQSSHKTL